MKRRRGLLENVPASFECPLGLEVSVERLQKVTKRHMFQSLFAECNLGTISAENVRLRRRVLWRSSSTGYEFVGRFQCSDGRVVLEGAFDSPRPMVVLAGLTCGFLAIICLVAMFGAPSAAGLLIALAPVALAIYLPLLVAFGRYVGQDDIAWLTGAIEAALKDYYRPSSP